VAGLVVFAVVLMTAIRVYRRLRERRAEAEPRVT
jgi:hypothetical protein